MFRPQYLLPVFLISGCAWIDDIGQAKSQADFQITAPQDVAGHPAESRLSCIQKQFPVRFTDFDADEPIDKNPRIRMYESIEESLRTNYAMITSASYDADTQAPCPSPDEFANGTFQVTANGCFQVFFQLNRCEGHPTARFIGTLTIENFSVERGKRISGTLAGSIEFVEQTHTSTETREIVTPLASLEGSFDFVNHAGAIWNR